MAEPLRDASLYGRMKGSSRPGVNVHCSEAGARAPRVALSHRSPLITRRLEERIFGKPFIRGIVSLRPIRSLLGFEKGLLVRNQNPYRRLNRIFPCLDDAVSACI